jgi:prolyl oligopeptidase
MLDQKQHAFDDFIAAAEWLIANHYTDPRHLAIYGGGHGGLLVGVAITTRPDLFRAAVAREPMLDMLRYERFPGGREWTPEYGSADDATQFKWLLAYSPYQHVKAGTRYPAVFFSTQENDPAVDPMHARKMIAALQAATFSDPHEQPILLRIDRAPTSAEAALDLELSDIVDQRQFLMWQLGMR